MLHLYVLFSYTRSCLIDIETVLWAGRQRICCSTPGRDNRIFCSPKRSERLWGSAKLISSLRTIFYREESLRCLSLTIYTILPHIFPKLRMYGGVPPLCHMSAWCAWVQLQFYFNPLNKMLRSECTDIYHLYTQQLFNITLFILLILSCVQLQIDEC